jgi:DNA-binding CsgD family transcriptional regulator
LSDTLQSGDDPPTPVFASPVVRSVPRSTRLSALGLTVDEEHVYGHLLASRSGSARALARLLRLPLADVEQSLARLAAAGLVRPRASDVPEYVPGAGVGPSGVAEIRYAAMPPGPVLSAQLADRAAELMRAGAAVEHLSAMYARRAEPSACGSGLAEVVVGSEAVERAVHELLTGSVAELLTLDRQPFVRAAHPRSLSSAMFDLIDRGVDVRTIYAGDAFRIAGYAEFMAEAARRGEHARLLAHLPLRFIVADRSTAMLPLEADGPWVAAALVVRGYALVEDLVHAFEELWDRADTSGPDAGVGPGSHPSALPLDAVGPGSGLSEEEVALLRMLADDMTEGAIGRHVGASARTVGRRLARLQRKLGARTRFSLGAEAGRRGVV